MKADMNIIGKRIADRRNAERIKQNVLAEWVNTSNNHMSDIENGKSSVSISLLCRICTALNVTPDYLLLGALHSNNVSQNIIDKLKLCNDEELTVINTILEAFISRHALDDRFKII